MSTSAETGRDGPVEQVRSQAQDAASAAQEKAVELKDQGRGKLSEQLDTRTTQAGGQARQVAQALRQSGEQMRSQGEDGQAAGIVTGAAERVERFGDYLERTSGDALMRDAEDFARRRPWLVAGAGLVAGLAASRFLKASSERRYETARPRGGTGYGTAPTPPPVARIGDVYDDAGVAVYADEPLGRESTTTGR